MRRARATNHSLPANFRPFSALRRTVGTLASAMCAVSLTTLAMSLGSAAPGAAAPAPGTIFVADSVNTTAGFIYVGTVTDYPVDRSGDVRPLVTVHMGISGPGYLAFDSSGDLWVTNNNNDTVVEYPKGELIEASPAPTVIISSIESGAASTIGPAGLTFDTSGDLWVANNNVDTVVEYTRTELAKTGAPVPHVTISLDTQGRTKVQPWPLHFDSSGNLWVAENNAVVEYAKGELTKSGSPDPRATLQIPSATDFAFDPSGDLWVALNDDRIVEYAKGKVATSGRPVTRVTISSNRSHSLDGPDCLIFDPAGDLWVGNDNNSSVVEFAKSELASSGSPTPVRTIAGAATGLYEPGALAFEP